MRINIIFFIFLVGCLPKNLTYMCGDMECVDKKQQNEFFSKNLSLEIKLKDSKKENSIDLITLNKDNKLKKKISTSQTFSSNSKKDDKKNELKNKKQLIKAKKIALKTKRAEEKKNKKRQKKLLKLKNKEKKEVVKKIKPIIPLVNNVENVNKDNNICSVLQECDIDIIASEIKKKGIKKNFPNIAKE